MRPQHPPPGFWASPLSAVAAVGDALRFGRVEVHGGAVYWSEGRPAENGRAPVMRLRRAGEPEELLPAPYSARSRVHEYGGGEFHVTPAGLFFVNDEDQQVHLRAENGEIRRITDAPGWRFADFAHDVGRNRLLCVAEVHNACLAHPRNVLAEIDLGRAGAQAHSVFLDGADFYASPRVSDDGSHLAWLQWNLPSMPWNAAELCIAALDASGSLSASRGIVAGGAGAAFQPEWSRGGRAFFIADCADGGRLFQTGDDGLRPCTHEGDLMRPLWSFNQRSWTLIGEGMAALASVAQGEVLLETLDLATGDRRRVASRLRSIEHIAADGEAAACVGAADDHASAVVRQPLAGGPHEILRAGAAENLTAAGISIGEALRLEGPDGEAVHGVYYPPRNAAFGLADGARPPCIVVCHGGPTGHSPRGLKLRTQFFASRGFAVLDLDYSGSTGYGRDYRERLNGRWGVRDAADAVAAAQALAARGLADARATFIYGSSAGGYTALMALCRSNVFAGAVSAYGISDLAALQRTTHKFESGYIFGLIGADPARPEEAEALMRARSPLAYADDIAKPALLLQGAEDRVVPPEQSELIAASLRSRGVPCELILFEGEGHGFRRRDTLIRALEAELAFYQRILIASAA